MKKVAEKWWLEAGPAQCPHCAVFVHLEVLLYCRDCDARVCPLCYFEVGEERLVLCPRCTIQPGGS